jgi:hypothetical protein
MHIILFCYDINYLSYLSPFFLQQTHLFCIIQVLLIKKNDCMLRAL